MAAAPGHHQQNLPTRSTTHSSAFSDEDVVPGEDTSELTNLFTERLRAYKHACGYLESYIEATEKVHKENAKEYEKVLKSVSHPLKEGDHFDASVGGIAGMFENVRSNTQAISNSHTETAKALKGTILPTFERLHTEIKNKTKELTKGAGKGAKAVDKARKDTQKHIESLGQHTAAFESTGGKISAADDPYVLQRGIMHRLHKQVAEENANRHDLIEVQNSFAQFEAHIIQMFQHGLGQLNMAVGQQAEVVKSHYGDMAANAQRVPLDFEWHGFVKRNSNVLIDPSSPPRSVAGIAFPNQHHRATQPLIAGSLDRKGKVLKRYDAGYYVVTPAKFLHEYKSDDDVQKDPVPEQSLFLPDCVVGALDGQKFNIKGKDASKGKLGIAMSHELQFKAHTTADAVKWYEVIKAAAGQVTNELPESPVVGGSGDSYGSTAAAGGLAGGAAAGGLAHHQQQPAPLQTQGVTGNQTVASPVAATPQSATLTGTAAPAAGTTAQYPPATAGITSPIAGTAAPAAAHAPAAHVPATHAPAAGGAPAPGTAV